MRGADDPGSLLFASCSDTYGNPTPLLVTIPDPDRLVRARASLSIHCAVVWPQNRGFGMSSRFSATSLSSFQPASTALAAPLLTTYSPSAPSRQTTSSPSCSHSSSRRASHKSTTSFDRRPRRHRRSSRREPEVTRLLLLLAVADPVWRKSCSCSCHSVCTTAGRSC